LASPFASPFSSPFSSPFASPFAFALLQPKAKVAFERLRAKVAILPPLPFHGYGQRLLALVKSKGAAGKSEGCL